jgi:hypothetical protein
MRRGIPAKFSPEMKMFVSAVTRSTPTGSVGPDGGDLRLYVCWLQTAFPSVPLSKCKSLAPFRAVQASFYGIPDELLWGNLLFCGSLLNLLKEMARKSYALDRHSSILLLLANVAQPTIVAMQRQHTYSSK